MPEVPVKLYVDKLLKDSRSLAKRLALLQGADKDRALRAMADRVEADADVILAANAKDVDAVGKSYEKDTIKDRMKAAVARVRMTADSIKEIADRLRVIADLPNPVGAMTGRWERPDGLQVSRVRVPIGVIGVISEMNPLVTVESIALCLKSGNLCIFRGAPEWNLTHQAVESALRSGAEKSGLSTSAWILVGRQEKEIAVELMRAGKSLDALIPRGGPGLRKAMVEQAKVPVLCHDGGLTQLYVDGETDIPLAQNIVINSKVQFAAAANALDTLLVEQV
ncbi:MAG: aldehyde dehydrogenase family protein, partial [Nitrospira sp.]|nr:aldehyde dehydrogenase family protein [Nitrospira sp.]